MVGPSLGLQKLCAAFSVIRKGMEWPQCYCKRDANISHLRVTLAYSYAIDSSQQVAKGKEEVERKPWMMIGRAFCSLAASSTSMFSSSSSAFALCSQFVTCSNQLLCLTAWTWISLHVTRQCTQGTIIDGLLYLSYMSLQTLRWLVLIGFGYPVFLILSRTYLV